MRRRVKSSPLKRLLMAGAAVLIIGCMSTADVAVTPLPASDPVSAAEIERDMNFLASDALEGRLTGTEGYDKAAAYVAERFAQIGLTPGGVEGFYQRIEFSQGYRQPDQVSLGARMVNGQALDLIRDADYLVSGSAGTANSTITGDAVFVGYGLVAPEQGRDDYEGLDVSGKVVVALSGAPAFLETEERAYYNNRKSREASDRGAIGFVTLETPTRNKVIKFEKIVARKVADQSRLTWMQADGTPYASAPNLRASGYMSMAGARKMMTAAGQDFDAIIAAAEDPQGNVEGMDLGMTLTVSQSSTIDRVMSSNVIGILEGSDPALKDEYIVLTAHLDHLGIVATKEGPEEVHNGALDNAAGVSALIDVARTLSDGPAPARSVMFLIVTAEEKGLLGAQYFTLNPTVPVEALVANVNLDMPVLTYDFRDVVVFGGRRSTIERSVETAAAELGLALSPDPFPEQGIFTRSDHYRFVEIGVPSVMLATGFQNGGDDAWAKHFADHYHQASDSMLLPIDFNAAARFADLNARITRTLANDPQKPLWRDGDFFARQFDGETE